MSVLCGLMFGHAWTDWYSVLDNLMARHCVHCGKQQTRLRSTEEHNAKPR